ncbi:MAG: carboxy terminal-processing peptidase, partial [Pseudomonadales bacterium]
GTYDPHTQYFSPRTSENFNINMSLSLEGIGAVLRTEDEYTTVVRLVPAGPADKSGLIQPEDRITGVAQGSAGKMVDVVGWRLDDVVELIRGPAGSRVQLEIIPNGQDESRTIQITRNTVKLEEQSAQKRILTYELDGRERKIGVIEVPTFYVDFKGQQRGDPNYKSTTRDVRRLIQELTQEGMEGLIVDLRNNGGGSLQESNSLTGLFIKLGPTVQVKSANNRVNPFYDNDNEVAWGGPLVVLVNRLSASASEIFAGAIQDYQRGIIVGAQTFGKGTVQTLIPLNRGQLKLTQAKFYRISGQSTQHQGVIPDIVYPGIYDAESIGESALDGALPWDVIAPARYRRSEQPIQPLVDTLAKQHEQRVRDDSEFAYLRALAERSREMRGHTLISLNEEKRRAEKAEEDAWRLALENDLRVAKGQAELKSLDELDEEPSTLAQATGGPAPLASVNSEAQGIEDESEDVDALLREGGNILLDFISLTTQVAAQTGLSTQEVVQ